MIWAINMIESHWVHIKTSNITNTNNAKYAECTKVWTNTTMKQAGITRYYKHYPILKQNTFLLHCWRVSNS